MFEIIFTCVAATNPIISSATTCVLRAGAEKPVVYATQQECELAKQIWYNAFVLDGPVNLRCVEKHP